MLEAMVLSALTLHLAASDAGGHGSLCTDSTPIAASDAGGHGSLCTDSTPIAASDAGGHGSLSLHCHTNRGYKSDNV